jgi:hypothetical protein
MITKKWVWHDTERRKNAPLLLLSSSLGGTLGEQAQHRRHQTPLPPLPPPEGATRQKPARRRRGGLSPATSPRGVFSRGSPPAGELLLRRGFGAACPRTSVVLVRMPMWSSPVPAWSCSPPSPHLGLVHPPPCSASVQRQPPPCGGCSRRRHAVRRPAPMAVWMTAAPLPCWCCSTRGRSRPADLVSERSTGAGPAFCPSRWDRSALWWLPAPVACVHPPAVVSTEWRRLACLDTSCQAPREISDPSLAGFGSGDALCVVLPPWRHHP